MRRLAMLLLTLLMAACRAPECQSSEGQAVCSFDWECGCGMNSTTGRCAYANTVCLREDISACPADFCAGIFGQLKIECVEGTCVPR